MRKRPHTAKTTTLGTSLTFTEARVEGAPRGASRAYVVRADDRRWVVRMDPHERRWRIDLWDLIPTVGVPGYFASPELAAGVLEIALVRGGSAHRMTLADVRVAIVEVRSGRTVAECAPIFDAGPVGLRATV